MIVPEMGRTPLHEFQYQLKQYAAFSNSIYYTLACISNEQCALDSRNRSVQVYWFLSLWKSSFLGKTASQGHVQFNFIVPLKSFVRQELFFCLPLPWPVPVPACGPLVPSHTVSSQSLPRKGITRPSSPCMLYLSLGLQRPSIIGHHLREKD